MAEMVDGSSVEKSSVILRCRAATAGQRHLEKRDARTGQERPVIFDARQVIKNASKVKIAFLLVDEKNSRTGSFAIPISRWFY
ncbi:MAG TPA: hypothetical protein EYP90_07520 [Chromatiaceae bacterium]|nr:hypothetical protein [Chromatiaceae bacterium]